MLVKYFLKIKKLLIFCIGFVRQLKQYEIENHGEKLVTPIQEQEQSPQD